MISGSTLAIFYRDAENWVTFANRLVKFPPNDVNLNYIKSEHRKKPICRLFRIREKIKSIYLLVYSRDKGSFDQLGLLFITLVLCCAVIYIALPPCVFWLEVDAPFHFFRIVLNDKWYKLAWSRIAMFLIRFLLERGAFVKA